MARPTLTWNNGYRLQGDKKIPAYEFSFGKAGTPEHFQSTLVGEEYQAMSAVARTHEANQRYDNWLAARGVVEEPTIAGLMAELDAIDDQIRSLQRRRLDVDEQIAMIERAARED